MTKRRCIRGDTCDVFPCGVHAKGAAVNPSLTAIANALRVGQDILQRLK